MVSFEPRKFLNKKEEFERKLQEADSRLEKEEGTKTFLRIYSDLENLHSLHEKLRKITAEFPYQDILLTCLHELVVNAMEHGNRFDPNKQITIELLVTTEYVLADIEDEGAGFDWYQKIDEPMDIENCEERGRGISMVQLLGGYLCYNHDGTRATLLITT